MSLERTTECWVVGLERTTESWVVGLERRAAAMGDWFVVSLISASRGLIFGDLRGLWWRYPNGLRSLLFDLS